MKRIVWRNIRPLAIPAKYLLLVLCGGLIACKPQARRLLATAFRNGATQETEINNTEIAITYIPSCMEHAANREWKSKPDNTQLTFRLSIHPRYDARPQPFPGDGIAACNIDSMLMLIAGADTLTPLYAHKMMPESAAGMEYLVGFDRKKAKDISPLHLVVKSWLSKEYLRFIYSRTLLKKIDDLSCDLR